jgi:hypothetical protein
MSYRVYWRDRVRHDLDVFQFLARELGRPVNAIPVAIEEIDAALASNPTTTGESRGDTERVLVVPPLTVYFEVFEEQRMVLIYQFRYYPR